MRPPGGWVRWVAGGVLLLATAALAAPYLPAGVLRGQVESALEASLGRRVDIRDVRFTFFPWGALPGPGFLLEDVTIHEDDRAGIEPFAYMRELGATVRIRSLLAGELRIASLNLGDASVNLVKTRAGPWNFQYLLPGTETALETAGGDPESSAARFPAIRIRGGRINFKFGDTKSPFYFADADVDVRPASDGSMEIRFGGNPTRSDRVARDFGRFFVSGTASAEGRLDLDVELDQSSLEETLRLMDPQGFGVHGVVALDGHIEGQPSALEVTGRIEVGDIHRWDLLPTEDATWDLDYRGTLDLHSERLELQSASPQDEPPFLVRFLSWDLLSAPQWEAGAEFRGMPLTPVLEIARHMGAGPPADLAVDGTMSGSAAYRKPEGLRGSLTLDQASLRLPGQPLLEAPEAEVEITPEAVRLASATVHLGEEQSVEVEASYTLDTRQLDLQITTAGLSVTAMRSFGLASIPVIEQTPRGMWSGRARLRGGQWSGASQLRDARFEIAGLAEPLDVDSAMVRFTGARVVAEDVQAHIGELSLEGSYSFDPAQVPSGEGRPYQFSVLAGEVDGVELQRLLQPTVQRDPGFLARTLGLGNPPPPPRWLLDRRIEGVLAVDALHLAGQTIRSLKASLEWDGTELHFTRIGGLIEPSAFSGDLTVDLNAPQPRFHYDGELTGVPYLEGTLNIAGTLDAEGLGREFFDSARVEGTLTGRGIAFTPEARFQRVTAMLKIEPGGSGPRWMLSDVEVTRDGTQLSGSGASADGRQLVLELGEGDERVSYEGQLIASTQPGP